jgi:hypothetical protein
LRSTMPVCISIAQRTASTTLRNSMMDPSPVRLTRRWRGQSDRYGGPVGAQGFCPRQRRRAGYSRRHLRPGSPRASGSRSLRPSWSRHTSRNASPCLRVLDGRTAHGRIPSVPGTKREGQLRVRFDPFTMSSGNDRYLRIPVVDCVVLARLNHSRRAETRNAFMIIVTCAPSAWPAIAFAPFSWLRRRLAQFRCQFATLLS